MKYKAVAAYDGSRYHGWQKQNNANGIQSVIEAAFAAFSREPVSITAAGRTDAGVHARGQVFHFESSLGMQPENFQRALNANLPLDIRILKVEAVDDAFHARFGAKAKRYDYWITYDRLDPFSFPYKTLSWKRLDINRMKKGAEYLLGRHDFTAYSSAKIHPDKSRIKTIASIEFLEHGEDLQVIFLGDGFLRYQVRMMMGTLMAVGAGDLEPEAVQQILESKDKEICRYNAPAQGLYLMEVFYE